MDILYLGKMFPKRASIMAKKELAWTPFLGWWSTSRTSLLASTRRSRPLTSPALSNVQCLCLGLYGSTASGARTLCR